MTERDRLVGKYLALFDRWQANRFGVTAKLPRYPWAYRAGLYRALDIVRARIDMIDRERIAA